MYNIWTMQQQGFTLIELLMTIAIIGVLAAIVLTSLNDARVEGIDAKVISEMDAISKRASIEHLQTGTFDIVCGTNSVTQSAEIARIIASINTLASSTVVCNSSATAYAVTAGLNTAFWCIDSTGVRQEQADPLTTTPPELQCS